MDHADVNDVAFVSGAQESIEPRLHPLHVAFGEFPVVTLISTKIANSTSLELQRLVPEVTIVVMTTPIELMVTVKAYPVIGKRIGEAVCVAGIRTDLQAPEWVRLFPVPFRDLPYGQQFSKYDVIRVDAERSTKDPRPESFRPNSEAYEIVKNIDSKKNWAKRYEYIEPLVIESMCEMRRIREKDGRSLGVFRPAEVLEFTWEKGDSQWGPKAGIAGQGSLLAPDKPILEKIPYTFRYRYRCADRDCPTHHQSIVDWEISAAYRNWRGQHPSDLELLKAIREKWLDMMCGPGRDPHFFVGNQHLHQDSFLVLGVFWPKKG